MKKAREGEIKEGTSNNCAKDIKSHTFKIAVIGTHTNIAYGMICYLLSSVEVLFLFVHNMSDK